jgi:NADH:ubiquinone oxidoreductase subunit E
MEIISVCVGSSCYLKGSYAVVSEFQRLIEEKELQDQFDLKAEFCQGNCMNAPCVRIGDRLLTKVTPQDVESILK